MRAEMLDFTSGFCQLSHSRALQRVFFHGFWLSLTSHRIYLVFASAAGESNFGL
jgi:hypothetical protein